jgi:hypothetical protein
LTGIGIAQFFDQRYEEAAGTLHASLQEFPNYAPTYRFLASCYAHMGRQEEAREIVERLRAFTSSVLESFSYIRNSGHRELFLSGLRLARRDNMSHTGDLAAILAADVGYSRLVGVTRGRGFAASSMLS